MAVISAQHHSAQTNDYVTTSATFFNMSDGDDSDEPAAPVTEYVAPVPYVTCTAPAPVIEYVPAGTCTEPVPVLELVSFAHDDTYAAPAPVTEHVALTLAVTFTAPSSAAPAPAVTCSTPAPETDFVTHPPLMEFVAPAPPVDFDAPSQMLPLAHIMAAAGVSLDTASVAFEPPRKKHYTGNDFSQLAAERDASSRAVEQSVADLKARIDLMNDHQEQLVASEQIRHVPVPQIQDPVEHDEPLAIGDMVLDTTGGLSRECEVISIGHSLYNEQCRVLYLWERRESYSSGEWKHRDRFVKLTNKQRRMSE